MDANQTARPGGGPERRVRGPSLIDGAAAFPVNRDRVIRAAAALFARNGYHATGIAELCSALGLSRGTLYYYVDGKETLLYEICRTQVLRMNEQAARIVAQPGPPEDRLHALAGSLLANISEHRDEWAVFFREFGNLRPDRRAEITRSRDEYEGYWLSVLLEQQPGRAVGVAPELIVKGLLGMFNYTYLWFRPDGRTTPRELAAAFTSLVLDGLRHDSERGSAGADK